jgi:transketolase
LTTANETLPTIPRTAAGADTGEDTLAELRHLSVEVRKSVLRMIFAARSGHVGSSLSCADVLTALRFEQMAWSTTPAERDVFVLSKGHAVPAWYAVLIVGGDIDPALEGRLRTLDSPLQGHPDRSRCDFVDVSTGALGQGLSIALGHARAKRLRGSAENVHCLLGDGECQEGQVWEAVLHAGAKGIGNLVAVVDHNRMQSDGPVSSTVPLDPLAEKFRSFGWHTQEIDGHSHEQIRSAFTAAKSESAAPSVIIAHTEKGRLGPGRVVLRGAHSGTLSDDEMCSAIAYLEAA